MIITFWRDRSNCNLWGQNFVSWLYIYPLIKIRLSQQTTNLSILIQTGSTLSTATIGSTPDTVWKDRLPIRSLALSRTYSISHSSSMRLTITKNSDPPTLVRSFVDSKESFGCLKLRLIETLRIQLSEYGQIDHTFLPNRLHPDRKGLHLH